MPNPDMRERILDAAERCFYQAGITATGVDALAEAAGISKRTLYNHFPSKDAVVTAYLQRREDRWRRRLEGALTGVTDPLEQIVAYVRAYCRNEHAPNDRGCPFINAAAELADESHPGVAVIRGSVANVEDGITSILAGAGVEGARSLAARVLLVIEGAMSLSGIRRDETPLDTAEEMVRSMVAPALEESSVY